MKTEPPAGNEREDPDADRRRLERVIPELVKRILEVGLDKLSEGPENVRRVVGDLKLPREALGSILSQLDETKSGLYRVVAKEVRDILQQTSFADEIVRALTALSFEIRTEVRFIPNDARTRPTPEVRSKVQVRRHGVPVSPETDSTTPSPSSSPTGGSGREPPDPSDETHR
ncbi:MAG TPA: hypothetical protein VD867_12350 [Burkholderiales bacterium]|nr:hypothetical protein [Burkholderiales bacterium]